MPLAEHMVIRGVPDLTAPMRVIWQGDDSEALHSLLVLPEPDLFVPSRTLGIDSFMLAHRLQRQDCARLLFAWGLWRPTVLTPDRAAGVPAAIRGLMHLAYSNYLRAHGLAVWRLYRAACMLVDATLSDQDGDNHAMRAGLHRCLAADVTMVPLLPQEQEHVDRWIQGAVLGRILAHFDQDTLLTRGPKLQLLRQTAARLGYPLDREHLYLGAPMTLEFSRQLR